MNYKYIDPNAVVANIANLNETIRVEYGCNIGPEVKTSINVHIHAHTIIKGSVTIGPFVEIGSESILVGPLDVKEYVKIGQGVNIGLESASDSLLPMGIIGKNAHIMKNAAVLGKLSIGEFAIVSSRARLIGDLPHHGVAWGVPAALKNFVCECGRVYASINQIGPGVFIGKCRVCSGPGYRIGSPILLHLGYTLLPNRQFGKKVPDWFFDDIENL